MTLVERLDLTPENTTYTCGEIAQIYLAIAKDIRELLPKKKTSTNSLDDDLYNFAYNQAILHMEEALRGYTDV